MQSSTRYYILFTIGIFVSWTLCNSQSVQHITDNGSHATHSKTTTLRLTLGALRQYTFFRIFAVNLYSDCKYWHEQHQCAEIGCAVCGECSSDDLPAEWVSEVSASSAAVNATVSSTLQTWTDKERELWIYDIGHTVHNDIKYIDIALNPEGYTGYVGDAAHRIWSAIYWENCFALESNSTFDEQCYERKVFYKLISGMHSTISAHIAWNWPTNAVYNGQQTQAYQPATLLSSTPMHSRTFTQPDDTQVTVHPNVQVFQDKLASDVERIDNLRFTYTVLLRALNKAAGALHKNEYSTGNRTEDEHVQQLVQQLLSDDAVIACSNDVMFDEKSMFVGDNSVQLKQEFQQHFRNVSAIMDCVGCEKCRLHGKLQVLGIGTALRVLFTEKAQLQRNEIMSLVVTLGKVTDALHFVQELQKLSGELDISNIKPIAVQHKVDAGTVLNDKTREANTTDVLLLPTDVNDVSLGSLNSAVAATLTTFSIIVAIAYMKSNVLYC